MSDLGRFPLKIDWQRVYELPWWLTAGSLADPEPPMVCFPLRSEWEATRFSVPDQYPAPAYTSRDSQAVEMPSAVAKLAQFAREASWEVRAQASMGNVPHGSTGRPAALKQLIALRFGAHPLTERQAYVVYETPASRSAWKPRSIMIWGPDLSPYAHCSIEALRLFLAEAPGAPAGGLKLWVRILEADRQQSEAFQKRRDTVRKQIRKIADEGRFRAAQQESRVEWFKIDSEWRAKVADAQEGVFSSEEVEAIIDPSRRRRASKEGLS